MSVVYTLALLDGDGIGSEIVSASRRIFESAVKKENINIDWISLPMGWDSIQEIGHPLTLETINKLEKTHGWILGPHDSGSYPKEFKDLRNPSGELRHQFDLYANIRPAKSIPGIKGVAMDADLVIYRENTEGFYVDRNMYKGIGEYQVTSDVVVTAGVFTKQAVERIAHEAFKKAMVRRKKVTIVHKANVIRLGSGLFLNVCREVAKKYPEVEVDDYHIDAMCAHLVRRIRDFDVIITENMFGDILSDLTGELVGSLGLAPSINTNMRQAMAQAAHGSAPDIAGEDLANPVGMILSTVMLFDWLGEKHGEEGLKKVAKQVEKALHLTLHEGIRTKDLGGEVGTKEFTLAVQAHMP